MHKYIKYIISITIVGLFVYLIYNFNGYENIESNENVAKASDTSASEVPIHDTIAQSNKTTSTLPSNDGEVDDTTSKDDNSSTNKSDDLETLNNKKNDNYSILVSSSFTKALVSLDEHNKEITIKLLDKNNTDNKEYDNYINITDENIKYLSQNSNKLLSEFKDGSLLDKYSLVCDTLKSYDTDLTSGDLVKIAFMYMK